MSSHVQYAMFEQRESGLLWIARKLKSGKYRFRGKLVSNAFMQHVLCCR